MKSNSTIVRPAITTKIAASVLALTCATAWKLSAAEIVWEGTGGISGSTDVNTEGAYFGSWAPADANAASFPVNGVTFKGVSDLPDFQTTLGGGYSGFGTPSTPDGNYDSLLTSGAYADNGAATFGWDGMTPGNTYLVQIWVEDLRNLGVTRSETFSGGSDVSPAVFFPADGTGNGNFAIGTFVADASGAETITINPFSTGGASSQVNLVEVRDVTSVPEPATGACLLLGLGCLAARRCRLI